MQWWCHRLEGEDGHDDQCEENCGARLKPAGAVGGYAGTFRGLGRMHCSSLSLNGEGSWSLRRGSTLQQARQAKYTEDYLNRNDRTSRCNRPFAARAFEGIGKYSADKRQKEWKRPEPGAAGDACGDEDHEDHSAKEWGRVAEVARPPQEEIQKQRGARGQPATALQWR